MVLFLLGILKLAGLLRPAAVACTGLCGIITSPFGDVWLPIVLAAVTMVIVILALIYALAPALGRNDIRAWVRVKIYDELATIVLIMLFAAFGAAIFAIQPANQLASVGLIPTDCPPTVSSGCIGSVTGPSGIQYLPNSCYGYTQLNAPPTPNPSLVTSPGPNTQYADYNNLFFISLCDYRTFNNNVNTFSEGLYWIAAISAIAPTIHKNYPGRALQGIGTWFQNYTFGHVGVSYNLDLLPIEPVFFYIVPYMNTIYILLVASQVQELLVASAGIVFAIFMAIGLIARAFGVTRTFGNAMIAFAIGIGFIYPLMVTISYGFLDSSLTVAGQEFTCVLGWPSPGGIGCGAFPTDQITGLLGSMIGIALGGFVGGALTLGSLPIALFPIINAFLIYGGLVAIGLTFIPLLNLVIVDVFIVDFSRAMGERMDFLSLFTRIL